MDFHPGFRAFEKIHKEGRPQLVWTEMVADLETAVSLMLKLSGAKSNSFMLESVTGGESRGRYSVIGMAPDIIWQAHGAKAQIKRCNPVTGAGEFAPETAPTLASLRDLIAGSRIGIPDGLPPMSAGLFGYLGYDIARLVERLPEPNPDPMNLPDAMMLRPTLIAIIDNVRDQVTLVTPVRDISGDARESYDAACDWLARALNLLAKPVGSGEVPATVASTPAPKPVSNTSRAAYLAMVERAREYIRAGDIFQVVPSQRWTLPLDATPFALYRALRRTNPSPYMFFFNMGGFHIVGASPEILVRVQNGKVTIRPIAGTRPRGETPEDDNRLEAELLADPKERAEHLMLLDLGRNDVGRVAKIGTVAANEQFTVERYSHVMHIVSNVEGKLTEDVDALDAFLAGMPAGTVSGAPKIRAMEIIDELETEKRGIYAGGVGYFSANGEMDTCIALRTGVVKDGMLHVQAGGGVVYDSDPEAEFHETVNKSKAMMRAADIARNFQ